MKRIALIVTCLAAILATPVFADDVTIPLQHRSVISISDIFRLGAISLPGELRIEPLLPQNALRVTGTADEIAEFREMLDLVDVEPPRARVTVRMLAANNLVIVQRMLSRFGGEEADVNLASAMVSDEGMGAKIGRGDLRVVAEASAEPVNGTRAMLTVGETEFEFVPQFNPDGSAKLLLTTAKLAEAAPEEIILRIDAGYRSLLSATDDTGRLIGPPYEFSVAAVHGGDPAAEAPAEEAATAAEPAPTSVKVSVRKVTADDEATLLSALLGEPETDEYRPMRMKFWDGAELQTELDRLLDTGIITVAYPPSVTVPAGEAGEAVSYTHLTLPTN